MMALEMMRVMPVTSSSIWDPETCAVISRVSNSLCICVYMYIYIYICMHIMYIYIYMHMYVCMYKDKYIYIYVYVHVFHIITGNQFATSKTPSSSFSLWPRLLKETLGQVCKKARVAQERARASARRKAIPQLLVLNEFKMQAI